MTLSARYTELSLAAGLGEEVEAVWTSVSDRAASYRVLPDGRCDIILRFDAGQRPITGVTVVVTGPTTRFYDVPIEPGIGFVGLRLRPGWFETVLGFEPAELTNSNLIGAQAIAACPALKCLCAPARDQNELVTSLTAFVRKRAADGRLVLAPLSRSVIGAFHAAGGRLRISDVAQMHAVSARTLQRLVVKATGLTPKALAGILQFHRALRLLRDHRLSPADAAVEAGFSDQAHMSRVIRRMGGFSPARLPDVTLVSLDD
ncbi:helix-turn-helix transcriptional regulator [Aminobacter sp. AP02]|uniref:helix-turn-helix transcriptional regulator n=1 Tax=Aminobacter sp. AP02 TaxID=2135737 RepID=UPI000D6C80FA|nr:helix-turn-helix transcriptional regulator [Aminobacter sp. AP02]